MTLRGLIFISIFSIVATAGITALGWFISTAINWIPAPQTDPSTPKDLRQMMPRARDQAIYDELRAIRKLLEEKE